MGSDSLPPCPKWTRVDFNPRSPCGERLAYRRRCGSGHRFQSTLPVWGATWQAVRLQLYHADFNPRSPCGERRFLSQLLHAASADFNPRSPCGERPITTLTTSPTSTISIHAPRVGSDVTPLTVCTTDFRFQSTLPVWGATAQATGQAMIGHISIHAPRVGSDHKDQ